MPHRKTIKDKNKIRLIIVLSIFIFGLLITGFLLYKRNLSSIEKPITENQEKINLLVDQIFQFGINIKKGPELKPNQKVRFLTDDEIEIIFSLDQDIKKQLSALQVILKNVKMENKKPKLIDLSTTKSYVNF